MEKAVERLSSMQGASKNIRNICVLAHVDHGKTTLSDGLIAHNGFISQKLAGKLRFMDFLEDEQRRGITMKSAAISLLYTPLALVGGESESGDKPEPLLINLIDSPGHVDFCSEVSTAARLSDGGLVVVDVVEGICVQTHAVLRQAWEERLQTCLVFNKLDRLIIEMGYSPLEAYERMRNQLHEINGVMSAFVSEKFISQADTLLATSMSEAYQAGGDDASGGVEDVDAKLEDILTEADHSDATFSVERGNVAFACAADGWAFRTDLFAEMYASKLGCSSKALRKGLWGDWFYHPKSKKIVGKKTAGGKLKPLFVQCILDPIWKLYQAAEAEKYGYTPEGKDLAGMAAALKVDVLEKDLKSTDRKYALNAVLKAWLPLSPAILEMVAHCLPSPVHSAPHRVFRLMPQPTLKAELAPGDAAELTASRRALATCNTAAGSPTTAFVSKMLAVPASSVHGTHSGNNATLFMGFGRVYSGTLREGDTMYVMNGAYDPSNLEEGTCQEVVIEELYLMMGQGMFRVKEVPAGNILAIGGLDKYVLKSATLSSTRMCAPFGNMMFQVAPIVKVAVEPETVSDMPALVEGLRLLNRSDAFVEVSLMETGEHVIAAAGEVHLERCISDLRERFARVELKVSPPLVSFREGIASTGSAEATTSNGLLTIKATTSPLPFYIPRIIEESAESLKQIVSSAHNKRRIDDDAVVKLVPELLGRLESSREASSLDEAETGGIIEEILSAAWALGPKQVGPNVMSVGKMLDGEGGDFVRPLGKASVGFAFGLSSNMAHPGDLSAGEGSKNTLINFYDPTVIGAIEGNALTGFQMATERGPLCDEPLFGVKVTLEVYSKVDPVKGGDDDDGAGVDQYGPFSGQVISAAREAIRQSVLKAGPRLVEAMYLSVITTTSEALGGTYSVLGRRRAKIVSETIREGTGVFIIHSYLPVATSFGFADELRQSSSGASNAQLMLSHWEHLDIDPFFTPKTEEEREEFGEDGDVGPNIARQMVDATRRRKGLKVRPPSRRAHMQSNLLLFPHCFPLQINVSLSFTPLRSQESYHIPRIHTCRLWRRSSRWQPSSARCLERHR
jgi:ribosome assembly protein 1